MYAVQCLTARFNGQLLHGISHNSTQLPWVFLAFISATWKVVEAIFRLGGQAPQQITTDLRSALMDQLT